MQRWTMLWTLPIALLVSLTAAHQPARAASQDAGGFLYGRVLTERGNDYTGFLRWGTEEACWDDLFHSSKGEMPYLDEVDEEELDDSHRRAYRDYETSVFGRLIRWRVDEDDYEVSRIFAARFGDIAWIEPRSDDRADVELKNGTRWEVSGYANDVGGNVRVQDPELGAIDLAWDGIERIEFLPVPAGAAPPAARLYGRVETTDEAFEGFIQWDKEECLAGDELDGDTEDGRIAIRMGSIESIARRSSSSCEVKLRDGRSHRLRGTNDVNDENRGIMVEDERYGRVTIPWAEFERVTFSDHPRSGRGYESYPPLGELRGSVAARGAAHRGRIVLDLDESEGWEMLNGSRHDIEFDIPLAEVRAIRPDGGGSVVELRNGQTLELDEGQDVTRRNAGVLVYEEGRPHPTYLRWRDIEEIRFD